jgi:hypothetical protein
MGCDPAGWGCVVGGEEGAGHGDESKC